MISLRGSTAWIGRFYYICNNSGSNERGNELDYVFDGDVFVPLMKLDLV